jgi:phage gp36-like protein
VTGYATPQMVRDALRVPDAAPADVVRIPVDALDDVTDIVPHITESDATVAVYCSGKDIPQAALAGWSRDIAAYLLVLAWRGSADFQTQTDPVWLRYQHAMTILEDIASGKISPVSVDPDGPSDLGSGAVYQPPTPRLVTTDVFGRPMIVDQPWGYPGSW